LLEYTDNEDIESSDAAFCLWMAQRTLEYVHDAMVKQTFEECSPRFHLKAFGEVAQFLEGKE
jgi:hypothetical protein